LIRRALLAFAAATLPTLVAAQAGPGASFLATKAGQVVRVRLLSNRTASGHFTPIGDGRLGIRTEAGAIDTFRVDQIREFALRGRHTKTGAIVGGIAGAGFGVFVGLLANALCEDATDCEGTTPYAIAIPLFGGGGALLGAAIGTAFPKWKRVFP
jgi:hypothetical protein